MNRRLVYVTIVGAGHYGKDLVAPKYKNNKFCKIKAVISPHVKMEVLSKSALANVPLYRTVDEWYENTGSILPINVFDLCVHHDVLKDLVFKLVGIGARNFVFPKPVSLSGTALNYFLKLQKRYNLKIAVASQWYYSDVTRQAKHLIADIKRQTNIKKVVLNFSQHQSYKQLKHYSPSNAFLPHILQILYSTGISPLRKAKILFSSKTKLRIKYESLEDTPDVFIEIDLKSRRKERTMTVYSYRKRSPELKVDFLAIFRSNKAIRYPFIIYRNNKLEIKEDNLGVMTNRIVGYFGKMITSKILTLNKYLPVAKHQIYLESLLHKNAE